MGDEKKRAEDRLPIRHRLAAGAMGDEKKILGGCLTGETAIWITGEI